MGFSIPSDPMLQFVVWLSLALLVLMLLLLLQIVLLRINLAARTSRERHFLEVWSPLLVAVIAGESIAIPRLSRNNFINFLKLWNHLQESLRGEAKERLNAVAMHCGMLGYSHSLLRKKKLRLRLLALNTLGHLGDRSVWDEILQLARLPDPLISIAAARALFQIDAKAALNELTNELLERDDWPTAQLAILLQEIGTESVFTVLTKNAGQLAAANSPGDLVRLKRLLQLFEIAPYHQAITTVREIFAVAADDEIIALCLKIFREPSDLVSVFASLGHPSWLVRLQAARALGRIGVKEDARKLLVLLSDPVWWVRYRTAQTIVDLVNGDSGMMAELREQLTDRYAKDMLEMAIAEKDGR